MLEVIATFYDDSRQRRVQSIRHHGAYTFEEERFSSDAREMSWLPLTWKRSLPICDSYDAALCEARGRVAWLADDTPREEASAPALNPKS